VGKAAALTPGRGFATGIHGIECVRTLIMPLESGDRVLLRDLCNESQAHRKPLPSRIILQFVEAGLTSLENNSIGPVLRFQESEIRVTCRKTLQSIDLHPKREISHSRPNALTIKPLGQSQDTHELRWHDVS
jgi:hypothetical protein